MKSPLILTTALCWAAASTAPAATATWKGGTVGVPDSWNISTNWLGGTGPTGNDAVFPNNASFIGVMQNTDATVNGIDVNAAGYTFADSGAAGGGLKVNAGGVTVVFAGTGFATFNTPLRADANQTWEMDGSRGTIRWNEPVNLNGKTLTLTGTGIQEINGGVTGAGNIIKQGTGRTEINSAITGGGGCTVYDGTIEFNNAAMSKTVSLVAPGVVAGTGSLTSLGTNGGTVRPGGGVTAVLNVFGSVLLNSTAVLDIQINGGTPGSGHDQLAAGNSVALNNASLNFAVESGYVPLIGVPVRIVDNKGSSPITGTFAGLPEGATIVKGSFTFRISYAGGGSANGDNDVTLTPLTVVPTGIERVWTGNVNQFWSNPGNWSGNTVPQPGDNVQFPDVAAAKKTTYDDLPWGYPVNLIRFTAGGYSLSGLGLALSDGIVQQAPAGAAPNNITVNLSTFPPDAPASVTRVRLQSGGPLTLDPTNGLGIYQPGSALVLQNDQSAPALTVRMLLVGACVISKQGTGRVILEEASQHSGGTHVYAGTLQASVQSALGSGVVGVEPGAVLEIGQAGGGGLNFSNLLDLGGTLRTAPGSPALTWSGAVQLQNSIDGNVVTAGGSLNLAGAISGDGSGMTFSGSSPISLGGQSPNAYTEPTVIDGVEVICNKSDDGVIAIPGSVIVSGAAAHLISSYADQISPGAAVSVSGGAIVYLTDHQTIYSLELDGGKIATTATLTITGGVQSIASANASEIEGTILTGIAPVTWNVAEGSAFTDLQFTGSLGPNGEAGASITKTGDGRLRVSDVAGSTHTGVTLTISGGTVDWSDLPDGSGSFGPDVIMNGGHFSGSGRVRDISVFAGSNFFSPGFGAGTMLCDDVILRSNLSVIAECLPIGADRLGVTGTVEIANASLGLYGDPPAYGSDWILIDNDGSDPVNGTFSGLPENSTITLGNAILRITYAGGDGNDVVLTRIPPPAPELTSANIGGSIAGGGLPGAPPARFGGTGVQGFSYGLEISDDLEHWVIAVSAIAGPDGSFNLEWNPPTIPQRRFFRVRSL